MNIYLVVKRSVDVVGAGLGLVLLSPVLLVVAILIRIQMGSPIIFKQIRPGLNGQSFKMYKFRTMLNEKFDSEGNLLPDAKRITKLGRFLRKTSIDELPELWNVLKGDMSLVGPRPLLVEYLPYYTEREQRRHAVRPGITGLAQVNGRNNLMWDERLELDVVYVENLSLSLDTSIIAKTIIKVIKQRNVMPPGTVVSPLNIERLKLDNEHMNVYSTEINKLEIGID